MSVESGDRYAGRDFDTGPRTYRDSSFDGKIAQTTGLAEMSAGVTVFDLMSGPGKVGMNLETRFPDKGINTVFVDLSLPQLKKIPPDESRGRLLASVDALPFAPEVADVAVARYGIKNFPEEEQLAVLKEIFAVLKPGGTFVLADMVSPDVLGAKEWLNSHHARKHALQSGDPDAEGVCHIPTQDEWIALLREAGFQVDVEKVDHHESHVSTTDWVKGKQFPVGKEDAALAAMNETIRTAPPQVKEAFAVEEGDDGKVEITYPVIIIKATKPMG
jgi:ubiquinone/menaquinone biosynthesis C-methylase UbiE